MFVAFAAFVWPFLGVMLIIVGSLKDSAVDAHAYAAENFRSTTRIDGTVSSYRDVRRV